MPQSEENPTKQGISVAACCAACYSNMPQRPFDMPQDRSGVFPAASSAPLPKLVAVRHRQFSRPAELRAVVAAPAQAVKDEEVFVRVFGLRDRQGFRNPARFFVV
jgi:hypothetical protein